VGCGRVVERTQLVRVTCRPGADGRPQAVLDRELRLGGRGAYLCRDGEAVAAPCLQQAERRRALSRALRAPVGLGASS
jgi:predicted RNA-binding protein YlxR (DUF448 family)